VELHVLSCPACRARVNDTTAVIDPAAVWTSTRTVIEAPGRRCSNASCGPADYPPTTPRLVALSSAFRSAWLLAPLHLFSPFTFFTTTDAGLEQLTFRGSPWLFIGWQACLCAVAVLVAVPRGADGAVRRRLTAALVAVSVAAAVTLGLTVAL
jgi:hypothetical protein